MVLAHALREEPPSGSQSLYLILFNQQRLLLLLGVRILARRVEVNTIPAFSLSCSLLSRCTVCVRSSVDSTL